MKKKRYADGLVGVTSMQNASKRTIELKGSAGPKFEAFVPLCGEVEEVVVLECESIEARKLLGSREPRNADWLLQGGEHLFRSLTTSTPFGRASTLFRLRRSYSAYT